MLRRYPRSIPTSAVRPQISSNGTPSGLTGHSYDYERYPALGASANRGHVCRWGTTLFRQPRDGQLPCQAHSLLGTSRRFWPTRGTIQVTLQIASLKILMWIMNFNARSLAWSV